MNSNTMDGKPVSYGEVALLEVDLNGLQESGGTISVKEAPTKLTETGSKAFASFYPKGQEMAPLSFTASTSGGSGVGGGSGATGGGSAAGGSAGAGTGSSAGGGGTGQEKTVTETVYEGPGCESKNARLANTGAQGVNLSVAGGVSALLAGTAAIIYARRRDKA